MMLRRYHEKEKKEYTLEELKSLAKEKEIKGYSKMSKEELLQALKESE